MLQAVATFRAAAWHLLKIDSGHDIASDLAGHLTILGWFAQHGGFVLPKCDTQYDEDQRETEIRLVVTACAMLRSLENYLARFTEPWGSQQHAAHAMFTPHLSFEALIGSKVDNDIYQAAGEDQYSICL